MKEPNNSEVEDSNFPQRETSICFCRINESINGWNG